MARSRAVERIPLVAGLARAFERLAQWRVGRVPVGLLALLPVALLLDLLDVPDELLAGPIGMGLSFILQSAFLLALTGRPSYAFGFAGIDLIPFVDTIPFATITLGMAIARAWRAPPREEPSRPEGPVIDV